MADSNKIDLELTTIVFSLILKRMSNHYFKSRKIQQSKTSFTAKYVNKVVT